MSGTQILFFGFFGPLKEDQSHSGTAETFRVRSSIGKQLARSKKMKARTTLTKSPDESLHTALTKTSFEQRSNPILDNHVRPTTRTNNEEEHYIQFSCLCQEDDSYC